MLTEKQFTQAVKKNMDPVCRVAVNYLRDPAAVEDVCQEVFLRLFRSGPVLRNWGCGEYRYKPEEIRMAGYRARTNLGPGSEGPAWLENGSAQINFYR